MDDDTYESMYSVFGVSEEMVVPLFSALIYSTLRFYLARGGGEHVTYLCERPLVAFRDVLNKQFRVGTRKGRKEERAQQDLEVAAAGD